MANVGVKVGGAWAALGLQQEQQKAVINELCSQLSSLHSRHEQLSSEYDQLELKHGGLIKTHSQTVADLQIRNRQLEDISGNLDTSNFLTKELEVAKQEVECHLRQTIQDLEDAAVSSQAVYQGQLHVLEQQIVELREIIDASMHTKRASTLKLETAMNALNLSKGDAKRFIEEVQAVKGKVEQLTGERDKALSEHVIVQQQRDCHADHAQLLVKENKRLVLQLQALRLQQIQASTAAAAELKLEKQAYAKQHSKQNATGSRKQDAQNENPCVSQKSLHVFAANDVQNVLHRKKPFDLSKCTLRKDSVSSKAVLMQAQQIRAAGRTN